MQCEGRERSLWTINKWLKVGKYNALSGNTASGHSEILERPLMMQRLCIVNTPRRFLLRVCERIDGEDEIFVLLLDSLALNLEGTCQHVIFRRPSLVHQPVLGGGLEGR